ncbi:hypothetical protein TNCV_3859751 [Trichonephila clavipes]|nr:hypothetical protein TNCV_3859751 [Trichonephila clavipes]
MVRDLKHQWQKTKLRCLQTLAEQSGVAFTPWLALLGGYTLDVLHPPHPVSPLRHESVRRVIEHQTEEEQASANEKSRKIRAVEATEQRALRLDDARYGVRSHVLQQ